MTDLLLRFKRSTGISPVELLCDVAGLAAISAGCFFITIWLGLIVSGLSMLALGFVVDRVASRGTH